MSLPTKQEVVQEAQTKGFSDRVKFGAKLGHQHAKNEKLSSFLNDIRSVRHIFQLSAPLGHEIAKAVIVPTFFSARFRTFFAASRRPMVSMTLYQALETNLRILW